MAMGLSGGSPWSLLCWLQFQPLRGWWGNSWWSELASLGVSFWGESLCWSNLNGCGVDRFTCGCPGPLTFIWDLVMARTISHQPSWILKGSVASAHPSKHECSIPGLTWTQALPKECLPKKGLPYLGPLPWLWWGLFWHSIAYPPLKALSRHGTVEVPHLSLQLMSHVFLTIN